MNGESRLRPWCGQPSDRGRLNNRTEQPSQTTPISAFCTAFHTFVTCVVNKVQIWSMARDFKFRILVGRVMTNCPQVGVVRVT